MLIIIVCIQRERIAFSFPQLTRDPKSTANVTTPLSPTDRVPATSTKGWLEYKVVGVQTGEPITQKQGATLLGRKQGSGYRYDRLLIAWRASVE